MVKNLLPLIFLGFLIISVFQIQNVRANELDYKINYIELKDQSDYQDGSATFKFLIEYEANSLYNCDYSCERYTSINQNDKSQFTLNGNKLTESGEFTINLQPNTGKVDGTFYVFCQRSGLFCTGSQTKSQPFSTNTYGFSGDNSCQNSKESCDTVKSDCKCSSVQRCEGSGLSAQCKTYCGNGVCESDESCSTCSTDCKKCDGLSCSSPVECKGGYCVNSFCSNKPYYLGDGVCSQKEGETCKNSPTECACGKLERCGQTAVCETYCGNGVCEESERGTCKADCSWCGDGVCSGVDNCKNCREDCGACKEDKIQPVSDTQNKNVLSNSQDTINENKDNSPITGNVVSDDNDLISSKKNMLNIIGISIIGGLILLTAIYLFRKNRTEKKSDKTKENNKNETK